MEGEFHREINLLKHINKRSENKEENLKELLRKLIAMMKYPRLVEMIWKQINYERKEYTKVPTGPDQAQ